MGKISPKPYKEANTLDHFRAHVLEGKKLPERLKQRFDQLDEVWNLVRTHGRRMGVKFFAKRHNMVPTSVYPIVNQALELFGDVLSGSKDGERQILADRLDDIYRKAMKEKDFTAANKAIENRMKILKLDQDTDGPAIREMPTIIMFTTDPGALKPEPEDIDYEPEESLS